MLEQKDVEYLIQHAKDCRAEFERLRDRPTPEEKKQITGLLPLARSIMVVADAAAEMARGGHLTYKTK